MIDNLKNKFIQTYQFGLSKIDIVCPVTNDLAISEITLNKRLKYNLIKKQIRKKLLWRVGYWALQNSLLTT